jgi:hypothetical protein
MRNHAETIIIRNRTYTLFQTYAHVDVAKNVAEMIRKGADFSHVVKDRGNNAVYIHRLG